MNRTEAPHLDGVEPWLAETLPLPSKLHAPRRRRGHVPRTALLDRLSRDQPDVILMTAPAGYGKSTLLAEIAATDGRAVAWLTVDSSHNDAGVLFAHIAYSMNQIEPVDPALTAQLWRDPSSITAPTFRRFARMFGDRRLPFVLVLDDVHELVASEALDALSMLIDELPLGSLLAIGSRRRPDLHLGRVGASHEVFDIGLADLAFGIAETAAMFGALGITIAPDDARRLVEHTEGWPLALYLAAAASGREVPAPAGRFGDTRQMVDYFSDGLLSGIEPEIADFVLAIAPLERFSGALCDEVLDRSGSATLLEELHRRNLLIIALDDRREWYRFHHLLEEFLTTELERRAPARAGALLARASRWHEALGDIDSAITCSARAGDMDRTASLVNGHVVHFTNNGRLTTVNRWLQLFSTEELSSRPQLMATAMLAGLAGGDGSGAATWLERAVAVVGDERPPDANGWVPPVATAAMRTIASWLPATDSATEAEYVYQRLRPGGDWQPLVCVSWAAALFMLGEHDRADGLLREAIGHTADRPTTQALAMAHLAVVHIERGRWDEANTVALDSRTVLGDRSVLPGICLVTAVHALALTRLGRADEAAADHQLSRRHLAGLDPVAPWVNLQTRIALARRALLTGETSEATTLLDETDGMLRALPDATTVVAQVAKLRRASAGKASRFGPDSLTTAELRVLQYLPTHLSVGEIAARLFLSRNTVKTHTIAIYRKLGVSSRSAAVDVARSAGVLE